MTRDEQIAAAERIARLNPGWTTDNEGNLYHHSTAWVKALSHGAWMAWPNDLSIIRSPEYESPAAAIRALGFALNEPASADA